MPHEDGRYRYPHRHPVPRIIRDCVDREMAREFGFGETSLLIRARDAFERGMEAAYAEHEREAAEVEAEVNGESI